MTADRPATEPRTDPLTTYGHLEEIIRLAERAINDLHEAEAEAESASPAALDVEAISETMWLNRHLLDAGTTGASRSAYRKVAKQIAARLTEQDASPSEGSGE